MLGEFFSEARKANVFRGDFCSRDDSSPQLRRELQENSQSNVLIVAFFGLFVIGCERNFHRQTRKRREKQEENLSPPHCNSWPSSDFSCFSPSTIAFSVSFLITRDGEDIHAFARVSLEAFTTNHIKEHNWFMGKVFHDTQDDGEKRKNFGSEASPIVLN
jgi:hypothetical protein